ncbi:zinc finger MYM-type protein 1-like [Polyergus mexicanus]|uniref:zinc finger MYM-type protein 1-like n=1 Tax=Polyergus mexicanus TaxID=615972 RepID=UPI0038B5DE6C
MWRRATGVLRVPNLASLGADREQLWPRKTGAYPYAKFPHGTLRLQGGFIIRSFSKYNNFHESARNHAQSEWHKQAVAEAVSLIAIKEKKKLSIVNAISRADIIVKNREKLGSIVRTIVFCGTHDLALRGKASNKGNFRDLLKFRVQADETSNIAGVEQLSLGVKFADLDNDKLVIREEFLRFVILKKFDAWSISEAILEKCESLNLNMKYCLGQEYDECFAMAGKENGVKSIIQRKYPNIHFVHCSSHRLNLVVHDLNKLGEIRNTIGTIKEIINFFKESNIRRQFLPSIPMLCETRWTEKHKTIGLFKRHLKVILEQLHEILEETTSGKQKAFCLYSAATKPGHIKRLIFVLQDERDQFGNIFTECESFSRSIGIDITIPRIVSKQIKRVNYTTEDPEEYFKLSLFLPYIHSLVSSLTIRFSEENKCIFNIFRLYPSNFKALIHEERKKLLLEIDKSGSLLLNDGLVWYKVVSEIEISNVEDMLKTAKFVPAIQRELLRSLSVPVTTATVERSFSTLRRVKTWRRSTMSESRLSGLCMLSTPRQIIANDEEGFLNKVIDKFGQDERRMVSLFD